MRMSGPWATGLRVAAYNAVGALLSMLVGAMLSNKGDGLDLQAGLLQGIAGILFAVLTFPAWLLRFDYTTSTGGGECVLWFLSPLIWGMIALAIHKFLIKRRERKNSHH